MAKTKKVTAEDAETGQSIQIEEVKTSVELIPVDQRAANEVSRFNIAREWIADRKKQYGKLKIKGLDDREGEKKVKAAWQEVRNKRLAVDKKHKEIKQDYLVITRAIDGEKNNLTDLLSEIEKPLKDELDRIDNEREELKMKAQREAEEKLRIRVEELAENGMGFNGSYYAIGETITMDAVTLKGLPDEDYQRLLDRVKIENESIIEAAAEKERQRLAEEKRLQDEREAQDKERQRLEDERKELERQKEEMEAARRELEAEKLRARVVKMEGLGCLFSTVNQAFYMTHKDLDYGLYFPMTEIEGENFNDLFSKASVEVDKFKKDVAEYEKQKAALEAEELQQKLEAEKKQTEINHRIELRTAELQNRFGMVKKNGEFVFESIITGDAMRCSVDSVTNATSEDWNAWIKIASERHDQILRSEKVVIAKENEEKENLRIAKLSDSEKIKEYLMKIQTVVNSSPDLSTASGTEYMTSLKKNILVKIQDAIEKLN